MSSCPKCECFLPVDATCRVCYPLEADVVASLARLWYASEIGAWYESLLNLFDEDDFLF